MNIDVICWGVGALVAISCLVRMANKRRKHLQGLLNDYVQRQILWVRRKQKAVELKEKASQEARGGGDGH